MEETSRGGSRAVAQYRRGHLQHHRSPAPTRTTEDSYLVGRAKFSAPESKTDRGQESVLGGRTAGACCERLETGVGRKSEDSTGKRKIHGKRMNLM